MQLRSSKSWNPKGHRGSKRSDAEVFFPVVFPLLSSVSSVVKICAAACQEAAGIAIVGRKRGF